MTQDPPGPAGSRMGELLRHLGESAERDAAARAGLLTSLRRVLMAPPRGPGDVLATVTTERPGLDSALVLVRDQARWQVQAAVGTDGLEIADDLPERGALADALRRGVPAQVHGEEVRPLLPAGTLAALLLPFAPARGEIDCLVVFGSRSQHSIEDADAIVAMVAAERVARIVESGRLSARAADADDADRRTGGFRDQVLAIVGHDLRNPLGAIVMSAALLQKKGNMAGWQAKTVERVRGSAARMGRIIDDLLSYTRTRLGSGIPVERRPADLGDVVRKIVEEVRVVHPAASVDVTLAGDLSGEWDPTRLEQVISNLVSNAIDHGDDDAPVQVGVCGGADRVELAVVNEGEIPDAVLEHAFEAFHRGPEQGGKKASGLGLGLFIAREIVRCHGGEISVLSKDRRTHVLVSLPRAASGSVEGARLE